MIKIFRQSSTPTTHALHEVNATELLLRVSGLPELDVGSKRGRRQRVAVVAIDQVGWQEGGTAA